jgi:ABC-type transporter MlaC component
MRLKGLRSQPLCAFIALCLFVPLSLADPLDKKSILRQQYEPIISSVSKQLLAKHEIFKKDPSAYQLFLDQFVRPYWNASSTARALIGGEDFRPLDKKSQLKLVDSVDKTLVRYAFEGIDYYSGQQFTLVDVAISDSGKMGWVQVVMKSKILPDLNLDILVKRNKKGVWKAVDVRLKGITYVAVKKYQFKKILKKQGVGALITSLNEKNNKFFSELCEAADKVDKVDKQFC